MDNIKIGDLINAIAKLKAEHNLSEEELNKIPVFIGEDDELNGIHTAWFAQSIDRKKSDDKGFFELIEEGHNAEPADISFLIS